MNSWSLYLFYLTLLLEKDCIGKKMCIRKFYTIRNSSFFQRIELPSAAQCAERCIDSIEHCKAALFAFDRNKSRGFCQLYNTNSNLSEIDISLDNNLNSISVVFEILDKCPATNDLASSGNDLMAEIKWELKKKLELWSDQEQPLLPITQDATVQHFKKNESTKWITINESLDKRNLRKENLLGKFGQREYHRRANYGRQEMAEQRFNRPDSSPLAGGPVPLIEDVSSSSFSSYDGRLLPQISHSSSSSFNFKENYLSKQDHHKSIPDNTDSFQDYLRDSHSLLTNGIPLPPPIKPVFVKHGQQEAPYDGRCREANCYAPSLAYLQQSGYNWPCSVYTDLCMPKKPHPCFTICQPVTTIQSSMPTTTAANHRFGGDIDGGNMEILKSQDLSSGPTLSSSRTEQLIPSWSEWSPGSPCSVTCGIGITTQKRFCSIEGHCSGEPVKEELCSNGPCPEWGPWSAWTECSQSCNGGKQSRSRTCSAGLRCDGPTVSIQACNVEKCAQWSAWSSWESCSVTCGSGQSIRRRKIENFGQCLGKNGSLLCVGEPTETRTCNQPTCPIWTSWHSWSVCSVSCGKGQRYRTRICYSGDNCIGNAEEHEICMRDSCPEWTDWSPWTQCTETCGTTGNKLRTRTCLKDNLVSAYCDGAAQDQITCKHLPECPSWTQWGHWSSCSVTCGHGQENRQRSCLPADMKCVGPEMEFRFCQDSVCPYWDEWSSWSGCSVTCGSGIQERRRKCEILAKAINRENFFPAFPAEKTRDMLSAVSNKKELASLYRVDLTNASGDFIKMSSNSTRRSTNILTPVMLSADANNSEARTTNSCIGSDVDRKQCSAGACCKLTQWTTWTVCSATCGGGTRQRNRMCSPENKPLNYGYNESSHYSKVVQNQILDPTMQHGSGSSHRRQRVLEPILGPQPIVPVGELEGLKRIRRQSMNIGNTRSFELDYFVAKADETICHCDGELHEKESCAQIPCPEGRNAYRCSWSQWCECTAPCNQDCSMQQTTEQNATPRLSPIQPAYSNPSQYNCRQRETTVNGNTNLGCTWSPWNTELSCTSGSRRRTRSCVGISSTRTECYCDGNAVEQITCSSPQVEVMISSQSIGETGGFPSSLPVMSRGIGTPGKRLTTYRYNLNTAFCSWSHWGMWSICSATCGTGKTVRKRSCPCRSCGFDKSVEIDSCELATCYFT